MKVLRLIALAAVTLIMASCHTDNGTENKDANGEATQTEKVTKAPTFDKAVIDELYNKVLENSENYANDPTILKTAIEQAEGLLTYFEQKYSADEIKAGIMEVAKGNEPFGAEDTELFKCLNKMKNVLFGQDEKMDDALKEAYAKMQEHSKAVLGE